MRIAVMVLSLALFLLVFLQSCAVHFISGLGPPNEIEEAAAGAGIFLAFAFVLGAAFVIRFPLLSMAIFALAALIAIPLGMQSAFKDLQVWGWISVFLAALSLFGHFERRRRLRPGAQAPGPSPDA